MEELIGKTLDRYELVELVGEGGMATVYRARQTRLQRDVAVKVLLPELAQDRNFRERFELEAQAVANLRHPNILTVHDYGEAEDGQLYLVVEYVRGGTLRERLEASPTVPPSVPPPASPPLGGTEGGMLPLPEALEIVAQVAEALDYAHRQGVVHRDVKPNNILLTPDGHPLLADFGLVKPVESDRRLTASGIMLGTPDYVAPEQAQALDIDGRADIYALGVMLFEVLTGRHPFSGETPVSIIIKHCTEPMPRPSQINSGISPALDAIVAKATAKNPDQRYQRAGEMARALRTALVPGETPEAGAQRVTPHQPPEPVSPVTPPPEPVSPIATPAAVVAPAERPAPWYRRGRLWAVVALALAAVLALAVLLISPSTPAGDEETAPVAALPTARPGEIMLLIAQFKAAEGSARYDVSQRIHDKLAADLARYGQTDVTVYQVPDVIESSEAAAALGQQYGAAMVMWGFYDDLGISPNIEGVGTAQESPLSVGLERLNLESGDAADFRRYIARDLPQELAFLTALSLVQTFMLQGDLNNTFILLTMAVENMPTDPQFRSSGEMVAFAQGMMALFGEQTDLERALEKMNQAIASAPDKSLFYTMRGWVYLQVPVVDRAMADLEQAIALEPRNRMALLLKGSLAWMMNDLETAASAYDQLIELAPDFYSLYLVRSIVGFCMGDLEATLEALDSAELQKWPGTPTDGFIPLARGLVYEKRGESELAASDYDRALKVGVVPTAAMQLLSNVSGEQLPPYAYLFECTTYQARGEFENALASCSRALEVETLCFDPLWKRGQLYAQQGDPEAALADYTAAIEADPSWPWVYYLRAQALAALGRTDEAQADLARALELEPVEELRLKIEALRE